MAPTRSELIANEDSQRQQITNRFILKLFEFALELSTELADFEGPSFNMLIGALSVTPGRSEHNFASDLLANWKSFCEKEPVKTQTWRNAASSMVNFKGERFVVDTDDPDYEAPKNENEWLYIGRCHIELDENSALGLQVIMTMCFAWDFAPEATESA